MKQFSIFFLLALACTTILQAQTANPQQYKYVFTVAKDGSGEFKYIQDAIDAMRVYPLAPITLYIKNGVYNEKISLPESNTDVTFIGESADKTIIVFNDGIAVDRIIGFDDFGGKDDFQTVALVKRLVKAGAFDDVKVGRRKVKPVKTLL